MPTTHTCEFENCTWKLETDNLEHYISLLKIHVDARHKKQTISAKAEKAKRPELTSDVSEEDWTYFKSRWDHYKKACGLTGEDTVTQLLECCNEGLRPMRSMTRSQCSPSSRAEYCSLLDHRGDLMKI